VNESDQEEDNTEGEPKAGEGEDEDQEELTDVEEGEEEEGEGNLQGEPDVSWNGLHFFCHLLHACRVHFVFQLTSFLQITFLFLVISKCVLISCRA